MRPGSQRNLTLSTARISPRFLSWKRLDRPRASIIDDPSQSAPGAHRCAVQVYYARRRGNIAVESWTKQLVTRFWGTTSNRLGAETVARTGIPEQARKHPSRGKVARGRSGAIGRISYFGALRTGASKPCIYNRISFQAECARGLNRAGCAGADRGEWIAGCETAF